MSGPSPESFLPLSHLSYHILLALHRGPLHGYAVVKAVGTTSDGFLTPRTGTFYSAIHRLLREGLIALSGEVPEASRDSRRKYYTLTTAGRHVLQAESRRLEALVKRARAAEEA